MNSLSRHVSPKGEQVTESVGWIQSQWKCAKFRGAYIPITLALFMNQIPNLCQVIGSFYNIVPNHNGVKHAASERERETATSVMSVWGFRFLASGKHAETSIISAFFNFPVTLHTVSVAARDEKYDFRQGEGDNYPNIDTAPKSREISFRVVAEMVMLVVGNDLFLCSSQQWIMWDEIFG